jgi:hypothetical protein
MIFSIKKQPLYMPMLGAFGGGSVRAFGLGAGEPRIVGVIQQGEVGASLTDPQVGDVVFATTGALENNATTLLSGYTSISSNTSPTNWSSGATYYVQGRIQYRVFDGTETGVPTITNASGSFIQYRFAKKVTSVSFADQYTANNGLSRSYSATSATAGVIRWVASGAYGYRAGTLSSGSPQYSQGDSYGSMLITETTSSGSATIGAAGFGGASFYITAKCNA